jgi:phage tail-like protein
MRDPNRTVPYPSYNYIVNFNAQGSRDPESALGGFSDVAGLKTELHIAEYRNGNDKNPHVHKYPGVHTVGDVTLKRGLVDSTDLWDWITTARTTGADAQRDVTITLRNEANQDVQIYKLFSAVPKGYTGPTLSGKGTGDLAIEELVLAAEGLEILPPNS